MKRKRVLITGIAGFLGTHVAEYFMKRGWSVIGIDNLTDYEIKRTGFNVTKSRAHNIDFLDKLCIDDFNKWDCRTVCDKDFPSLDLIIHCAAQPAMTIAIEDPVYDADNNIFGTINMLNIAKKKKCPFINCSSIHIYGNQGNEYITEGETRFISSISERNELGGILLGDLTPLHASKRTTELYTQTFGETYKMRTTSFRLTGMYGERQFGGMDHGWVANFAIRNIKERPITIFGTDKQVRDILYAEDAARAFYMWYKNDGSNGIFNIGGGMESSISLGECMQEIAKQTGKSNELKHEGKRFGDLWYFVCDYKKAHHDFQWKPLIRPKDGIARLIKWIKENEGILE